MRDGLIEIPIVDSFFGVKTATLALSSLFAVLLTLSLLAIRAWRWPIFLRLGLRQLPRRPSQTVLIVAGLMLSTALVAASLATGDTITRAIAQRRRARAGAAG